MSDEFNTIDDVIEWLEETQLQDGRGYWIAWDAMKACLLRYQTAVSCLSAEDARIAAERLGHGLNWKELPEAGPLRDYARVLSDEV